MLNKKENLRLVYVLYVGENHRNEYIYEFIFSLISDEEIFKNEQDKDSYWGWFESPASIHANPPSNEYIDYVFKISTSILKLNVLHENEFFSYSDAIDKIVSLAWEELPNGSNHDEKELEELMANHPVLNGKATRLVFNFGESLEEVQDKLYSRDIKYREA